MTFNYGDYFSYKPALCKSISMASCVSKIKTFYLLLSFKTPEITLSYAQNNIVSYIQIKFWIPYLLSFNSNIFPNTFKSHTKIHMGSIVNVIQISSLTASVSSIWEWIYLWSFSIALKCNWYAFYFDTCFAHVACDNNRWLGIMSLLSFKSCTNTAVTPGL